MSIEHSTGKILYTEQDDLFVLKLTGDVRLTLCTALDTAISKLFAENKFKGVTLDLTDAVSLDSTTLGLLAKLSILAKQSINVLPTLETSNEDIIRLLDSMGIKDSFYITEGKQEQWLDLKDLTSDVCSEAFVKEKVLEAHKILMDVNDNNKAAFKDLVSTLEAQ